MKKESNEDIEIWNGIFLVTKKDKVLKGCVETDIPEHLIIPEGIEEIGRWALSQEHTHKIKSVKLPNSLKRIDEWAFSQCFDLIAVQFGSGLEYSGTCAFAAGPKFETLVFPDSLRVIGTSAFGECSKLKNVRLNEGLQVIEASAFYGCEKLQEIVLPASVNVLGDRALQLVKKIVVHGALPYNLIRATDIPYSTSHSIYLYNKYKMTTEIVTDNGTYFLPKYVAKEDVTKCECAFNSGIPERMQTVYEYGNRAAASADTAFSMYMTLLKAGQEPCDKLKKYVKRISKYIVMHLIEIDKIDDVAEFIQLGLLTPAAIKSLYENAIAENRLDVAAYLMNEVEKRKKKSQMNL